MLRILGRSKLFERPESVQYCMVKCLNTVAQAEIASKNNVNGARRFLAARKERQLERSNQDFVSDLFAGVFDKGIFKYSLTIEDDVLDNLLKHSAVVENYLRRHNDTSESHSDKLNILKNLELYGLNVPQQYGGLGYSNVETAFMQECVFSDPSLARLLAFNVNFGGNLLTLYGSNEQKVKYLNKIATGEMLMSFAYNEGMSFIDLSNINTTALIDEEKNCFVINGKKQCVVNANVADVFAVLTVGKVLQQRTIDKVFHLFLVDKNTPGITIQRPINSKSAKEFGLFEVNFKDVVVPMDSIIGNKHESAYDIVKRLISQNYMSSSASCLASLKYILHIVSEHSQRKVIYDKAILEQDPVIKTNIGFLTVCVYVLESIIYMISEKFDNYDNPNLYLESSICKTLALDFLNQGINKYIEVLGNESYKLPSLLEQALQVLYYNSAIDENPLHLKLIVGGAGIIHAVQSSSVMRENVSVRRNPYMFPSKMLQLLGKQRRIKKLMSHNLKMELNGSLRVSADILEESLVKLNLALENHLTCHGNEAVRVGFHVVKLSEMAIYVYALAVCLSRASNSFCNDIRNSENEIYLANSFAQEVKMHCDLLYEEVINFSDYPERYEKIGLHTFEIKQYPVEHPLSRSY